MSRRFSILALIFPSLLVGTPPLSASEAATGGESATPVEGLELLEDDVAEEVEESDASASSEQAPPPADVELSASEKGAEARSPAPPSQASASREKTSEEQENQPAARDEEPAEHQPSAAAAGQVSGEESGQKSVSAEPSPERGSKATEPEPADASAPAEPPTLEDVCSDFRGEESLATLQSLLSSGAELNSLTLSGDTPLLLLCQSLELDYRYRTEPGYRSSLEEALILLLRSGADPLHENEEGCNAVFFIEGQPELAQRLKALHLLPRELALRIPAEGAALTRYIRLRSAQALLTTHEGSLEYLARRYCAPAYDRVFARLQRYLRAESSARLPENALRDCLAFLRVADSERIGAWVDQHALWEHSEHFLEEVPERFLEALCELDWRVDPVRLRLALKKLDATLPHAQEDMIDCFSGLPMARLLHMLASVEPAKVEPLLKEYADARDSTLAAEALRLQLARRQLPPPEEEAMRSRFSPLGENGALSQDQTDLLEIARVDAAASRARWDGVDAATVRRVQERLRELGLEHHADLLSLLVEGESITSDEAALAEVQAAWTDPAEPSPQMLLARALLRHPEYCEPLPSSPSSTP